VNGGGFSFTPSGCVIRISLDAPLAVGARLGPYEILSPLGAFLGTAAYMSPEQAKGRPADKRSDLWAFGCVLYEMPSGLQLFVSLPPGANRFQ